MENPFDEEDDQEESARFLMSAQNPTNGIDEAMETSNEDDECEMNVGDDDGVINNVQILVKDVITVECQKLNGKQFNGTVNYSEAKSKIFKDGLGLNTSLLSQVKLSYNKCPVVTFKLNSEINVIQSVKSSSFKFTRMYHSKGELVTDEIECKVIGMDPPEARRQRNERNERNHSNLNQNPSQHTNSIHEAIVKIEGCDSLESAIQIKNCLVYYGDLLSDVKESTHYDPDPNAQPVGNGIYNIKMRLLRQIPNYIPAAGKKIRISYEECTYLCSNCFRVHSRKNCQNPKVRWIDYVKRFISNNEKIQEDWYGKWWNIIFKDNSNYKSKTPPTTQAQTPKDRGGPWRG